MQTNQLVLLDPLYLAQYHRLMMNCCKFLQPKLLNKREMETTQSKQRTARCKYAELALVDTKCFEKCLKIMQKEISSF